MSTDDERWLTIDGRRWRRTDPLLPEELVTELKSELGKARAAVRTATKAGDQDAVAGARRRVGIAKTGLGERGDYWWDLPEVERRDRAKRALGELRARAR